MQKFRSTANKIDRLSGTCFENALRLHFDAIRLYKAKSYSSALALSILSIEELAKAHVYEDIVWHARIDGTPIDSSLDLWKKYILSHKVKHKIFASRAFFPQWVIENGIGTVKGNAFWQMAQSEKLEKLKQQALYVGLSSSSKKKGRERISNPLRIKYQTAKKMITIVNDYLIDLIIGVLGEWYSVDSDAFESKINRNLLRRLIKSWSYKGQTGIKAIKLDLKSKTG